MDYLMQKGMAYMAAGLIGAGDGLFDIPAYLQAGALGVVVLMVVLGFKSQSADRASRATEAAADRVERAAEHKRNLEAIQRAYEHRKDQS